GAEQRETAAQRHLAIEPAIVRGAIALVAERRQDEHRQRARRVLQPEVAVWHRTLRGDRVAVALVGAGVADLVVAQRAVVEQGPRADEEPERDDGDEHPGSSR